MHSYRAGMHMPAAMTLVLGCVLGQEFQVMPRELARAVCIGANDETFGKGDDGAPLVFASIGARSGGPWPCEEEGCPAPTVDCPLWAEDAEKAHACLRRMSYFWDTVPEILGNGSTLVLEHCPQLCNSSAMPCVITGGKGACYGKPAGSFCGAHGAHCLEHPTNGKKECVRSILGGACESYAFLPPCGIVLDDGVAIEIAEVPAHDKRGGVQHTIHQCPTPKPSRLR